MFLKNKAFFSLWRLCYRKASGLCFLFQETTSLCLICKFLCLSWKTVSSETCGLEPSLGNRFSHPCVHVCMYVCMYVYGTVYILYASIFWRAWNYFQSVSLFQLGQEHCSEGAAEGTQHMGIRGCMRCLLPVMSHAPGYVSMYLPFAKEVTFLFFLICHCGVAQIPTELHKGSMMRITGHCRNCSLMYHT